MPLNKTTRNPDKDFIRVNQILGRQASLGMIPAHQIMPWSILVLFSYLMTNFFFSLGLMPFFLMSFWLIVSWWLLTGKRPHLFIDRFRYPPGKEWCYGGKRYIPLTPHQRRQQLRDRAHQIKDQKLPPAIVQRQQGGKFKFMPFENEVDICSLVKIVKNDRQIAGLLLKSQNEQTYQVIFPFRLSGLHDILYSEEVSTASKNLEAGWREIPQGEKITLYGGCHSRDRDRQSYLSKVSRNCELEPISVLIRNEQRRIQQLKRNGNRSSWEQIAFCTWTVNDQGQSSKRDTLGKIINRTQNLGSRIWGQLSGNQRLRSEKFYTRLLLKAFESGFLRWEVLLNTKMNLQATPMTLEEIWQWLWERFNNTVAPDDLPQVLTLNETESGFYLSENINVPHHIISLLIAGSKGRSACPEHREDKDRILLNGKGKEVGVLSMFDLPQGWSSTRAQLRWIWDILSGGYVRDTEAWIELSLDNEFLIKDNLAKQAKQSKAAAQRAGKKGQGRDIGAEIKQSESFEAQARLYRGVKPIKAAVVFLVFRENREDLNNACSILANSFGAVRVVRERNVAWEIWLQTLPITLKWLLHSGSWASERRLTFDSDTVNGVLPLTVPRDIDRRGLEFVSHQGGKPVYLDLLHEDIKRMLIVGESGSGKSVLGCRVALEALAHNIPVVGMDMSMGGRSTFATFIKLLGDRGAYYDITTESSNLLEPPDLRHFDKVERERRKESWKESLRQALLAIAMGKINAPRLKQRVDSILIRMLDIYLRDPEIVKRYNKAFEQGWKSPAWQQIPTLKDLLRFCARERLNLRNFEEIDRMAINQIHSQFQALLASRLGKAVGRPSTFSPEPAMKFFALSNLGNENDAYILAINAYAACMRNAIAHQKSLFIGDELSVLFHKEGFANMVGSLCATGRKEGIATCLIAQDYDSICQSSAGAQIMQNMSYKLSGRLTNVGVAAAQHFLQYPKAVISENATESFIPSRSSLYSAWLIESGGRFWRTRFYPGEMLLAAVANHHSERAARDRVLQQYPSTQSGQLRGLRAFSDQYIAALKNQTGFERIGRTQDKR